MRASAVERTLHRFGDLAHDSDPSAPSGSHQYHSCLARHASHNPTNVYAEVDLEMKAKALSLAKSVGLYPQKPRKKDPTKN